MTMKFTRGVAAVATTAALVLAGCTSQGGSDSPDGGGASADDTLTIGARVDNNSFDPADLEIGNRVQYGQPVYDTLGAALCRGWSRSLSW